MKSLIFLLLLAGCAPHHQNQVSIDPKYQAIVDKFVAEAAEQGHPVIVQDLIIKDEDISQIDTLSRDATAVCVQTENDTPTILMSTELADESQVEGFTEMVLYHELGHCLLQRVHRNDYMTGAGGYTVAASVMNADVTLPVYYELNRAYYIHELFHTDLTPNIWRFYEYALHLRRHLGL